MSTRPVQHAVPLTVPCALAGGLYFIWLGRLAYGLGRSVVYYVGDVGGLGFVAWLRDGRLSIHPRCGERDLRLPNARILAANRPDYLGVIAASEEAARSQGLDT